MAIDFQIGCFRKRRIHSFMFIVIAACLCCTNATAQNAAGAITCGVPSAQTAPVLSSTRFTLVLNMQSGDDHGKNTHLCQTEYTLQIIRPDGSSMQPLESGNSIDKWNRPLVFRIDGFSRDGNDAFVFIAEGAYPQWIEMHEYDMKSGKETQEIFLDRHFTKRLSRECAATLRIVGTSRRGRMVLGSDPEHGCSRARLWELRPNKTTGPTGALSENPTLLSFKATINKLEAGAAIRR